MKLSVLIATYNRKQLLSKCLKHLLDQSDNKPDEVIVVIGGRDGSGKIVRNYNTNYPFVKLIEVDNKSLGDSQNKGLPHCTGDIVATLDDDAFVFPDWTKMVKTAHDEHPEAGCIGGRIINLYPNNLIARLESHIGMPYDLDKGFYTRTIAGVSCTYKRNVMEKVGSFDDSFPAGMDSDYNWRVLKSGYKVWFDPRIRMYHQNRTKLIDFLEQQKWYGRGYYLVRRKNRDLYTAFPRDLRRWQDWIKLMWFLPGIFIDAFIAGLSAKSHSDRVPFVFLIILKEVWWRYGWLKQLVHSIGKNL